MPTTRTNSVDLYYELCGSGEPLVLVHGSWIDHHTWDAVVPLLSRTHRVLVFDRRGHGRSERPAGQGSIAEDADDVAGLIEALELGPAHLAGSSWGGSIVLWTAARWPDLVRSAIVHEPPLFDLLDEDHEPELARLRTTLTSIAERLAGGDLDGGARRYADEVAYGPGAWTTLPEPIQRAFLTNGPTYLDQCRDPQQMSIDLAALVGVDRPVLLTEGDQRPSYFGRIIEQLARALPRASRLLLPGAAHDPQMSDPQRFAGAVADFCAPAYDGAGA